MEGRRKIMEREKNNVKGVEQGVEQAFTDN
jgi:hypothetical protein